MFFTFTKELVNKTTEIKNKKHIITFIVNKLSLFGTLGSVSIYKPTNKYNIYERVNDTGLLYLYLQLQRFWYKFLKCISALSNLIACWAYTVVML